MGDMRPGIFDDSASAISPQTIEDLVSDLLRRHAGVSIVDDALGEDPGADNDRLTRDSTGNPFNVWAV
jgi:hypothetical protein